MRVIVVGAGPAGLVCARALARAGVEIVVLEKSDDVGGRVRTDERDGFRLDRGFQVLFTAYPAARRQLDLTKLDLRAYDPGALIAQGDRRHVLTDPARDPDALGSALASGLLPLSDKIRAWRLSGELGAKPFTELLDGPDQSTARFLRRRGFSETFLDHFLRPFFGGIFLDPSLETSARCFQFNWRMLTDGDTTVPALGMGEISRQLAAEIQGAIQCETGAKSLVHDAAGRVTGVCAATGETFAADRVVVATPAPEAARLTGLPMPEGARGVTTLYFAGDEPLWVEKKIMLHANRTPLVHHATQISNTAPEQAPAGQHLLCATVLGIPTHDDVALDTAVRADIRRMFTGDTRAQAAWERYRTLTVSRIPFAQFAQPPGIRHRLPENRTAVAGLYLAGEFTAASSLNAAMHSGEKAAAAILEDIR